MAGILDLMKKSPSGQTEQSERRFRRNKQFLHRHEGVALWLSHKLGKIQAKREQYGGQPLFEDGELSDVTWAVYVLQSNKLKKRD